jgi:hypothetical protein
MKFLMPGEGFIQSASSHQEIQSQHYNDKSTGFKMFESIFPKLPQTTCSGLPLSRENKFPALFPDRFAIRN